MGSPSPAPGFRDLGVSPALTPVLSLLSIRQPTPIQAAALPRVFTGGDVCGVSRTGSGKTLCFALPVLQELALDPYGVFALVLEPTRELALQVADQFEALGAPLGLSCGCLVGGESVAADGALLESRPHVLVATPGRLAYLLTTDRARAALRRTRYLVLDEADRLLCGDPEFEEQLSRVLRCLPSPEDGRRTLLFTATLTERLRAVLGPPGKPRFALVCPDGEELGVPSSLDQRYLLVPQPMHKLVWLAWILSCASGIELVRREDGREPNTAYLPPPELRRLADGSADPEALRAQALSSPQSIIVFCDTVEECALVELTLRQLRLPCCALHGALSTRQRLHSLSRFRRLEARILVCTDLASRGLDIESVDLVVNWSVPPDPETYVHRAGRTARAGRAGRVLTFVGRSDLERLRAVEAALGRRLEPLESVADNTNGGREARPDEELVLRTLFARVARVSKAARLQVLEWGLGERAEERRRRRAAARLRARAGETGKARFTAGCSGLALGPRAAGLALQHRLDHIAVLLQQRQGPLAVHAALLHDSGDVHLAEASLAGKGLGRLRRGLPRFAEGLLLLHHRHQLLCLQGEVRGPRFP